MQILIVSATHQEIDFLNNLNSKVDILIGGAGIFSTIFNLTEALNKKNFDLCINTGIAGSFNRSIQLGEVVNVAADSFPEFGAEDGDGFIPASDLVLMDDNQIPFEAGVIKNKFEINSKQLSSIKQVTGITKMTVTGNDTSVNRFKKLNADVESMEGAAFLYVCRLKNIPCLQIRAVSNYVERRNRKAWKLPEALSSLEKFMTAFLDELSVTK
jgi:futalosine hydrolase